MGLHRLGSRSTWPPFMGSLLRTAESGTADAERCPRDRRVAERLAVFAEAYGVNDLPADIRRVAVERCEREAELIFRLGEAREPPYDRLLREGHGEIWNSAATHVAARMPTWQQALRLG